MERAHVIGGKFHLRFLSWTKISHQYWWAINEPFDHKWSNLFITGRKPVRSFHSYMLEYIKKIVYHVEKRITHDSVRWIWHTKLHICLKKFLICICWTTNENFSLLYPKLFARWWPQTLSVGQKSRMLSVRDCLDTFRKKKVDSIKLIRSLYPQNKTTIKKVAAWVSPSLKAMTVSSAGTEPIAIFYDVEDVLCWLDTT